MPSTLLQQGKFQIPINELPDSVADGSATLRFEGMKGDDVLFAISPIDPSTSPTPLTGLVLQVPLSLINRTKRRFRA